MKGQITIKNLHIVNNKIIIDIDVDINDDNPVPIPDPDPVPDRHPPPEGYDSDENVAWGMLQKTIEKHNLDPIAIQGHGKVVADALNKDWPGLRAYAHPKSDALMWKGFGSLDITKDSGKGGFYFRVDHQGTYDEAYARSIYP